MFIIGISPLTASVKGAFFIQLYFIGLGSQIKINQKIMPPRNKETALSKDQDSDDTVYLGETLANMQPLASAIVKLEVEPDIEELAATMYDAYSEATDGFAFNLPGSDEFMNDPTKQKQANAWRQVAILAKSLFEADKETSAAKSDIEAKYESIISIIGNKSNEELHDIISEHDTKHLLSVVNFESDDDDFADDDEHVLNHAHIKQFGLKLNKAQAMELQPHVSRIAQHGLEEPELIEI